MKRSTTTSLASLQRWAAALGVAASLSGAACKPEATSDAPSSSSAAVSSTAPATQVVSAPPSASAATPAPKPWAKAIKRDLELRLGNAKLGEINIEWTPTASGFRSTVKSWIAMKVTTNDGAVSRSENDEEEAYDAHGQLLTSTKIDRENGVEEREEVSIADGKLRAKVKKPSHEDDRTLLLPPDFDNEILVFTKLREAVLGGAAMPRAASYASFDTDDMDFERKILRIVGKTTIETPDGKIDGWQIEEVDVKSGDVVKGVADDAGFPLRVEFGAFTAVIKGTPGGGDMAEIDSNVPIEGSYKEGVSELLVEVTVKGDSGTDPGHLRGVPVPEGRAQRRRVQPHAPAAPRFGGAHGGDAADEGPAGGHLQVPGSHRDEPVDRSGDRRAREGDRRRRGRQQAGGTKDRGLGQQEPGQEGRHPRRRLRRGDDEVKARRLHRAHCARRRARARGRHPPPGARRGSCSSRGRRSRAGTTPGPSCGSASGS
jgi:hypothetical protein